MGEGRTGGVQVGSGGGVVLTVCHVPECIGLYGESVGGHMGVGLADTIRIV